MSGCVVEGGWIGRERLGGGFLGAWVVGGVYLRGTWMDVEWSEWRTISTGV